jgi:hypothetical protein
MGRLGAPPPVKTLEEITYDAGRHALAEQEALVAGIRQRTGTLLAAHALVASFLGAATIGSHGLRAWTWIALVALVSAILSGLMIVQTLAWIAGLAE